MTIGDDLILAIAASASQAVFLILRRQLKNFIKEAIVRLLQLEPRRRADQETIDALLATIATLSAQLEECKSDKGEYTTWE